MRGVKLGTELKGQCFFWGVTLRNPFNRPSRGRNPFQIFKTPPKSLAKQHPSTHAPSFTPMFFSGIAALLVALQVALGQGTLMNSITTYATADCTGDPVFTDLPVGITDQCTAVASSSTVFYKLGCSQYRVWITSNTCDGPATITDELQSCYADTTNQISYSLSCAEHENLVRVNFVYALCEAAVDPLYTAFVPLNQCTPVGGIGAQSYNAISVNFQRSFLITEDQATGAYMVKYFYTGGCTGNAVTFPAVGNEQCTTAGSGEGSGPGSTQSVMVSRLTTTTTTPPNEDTASPTSSDNNSTTLPPPVTTTLAPSARRVTLSPTRTTVPITRTPTRTPTSSATTYAAGVWTVLALMMVTLL